MGDAQVEVWVSDVLSSQMCHPAAAYQICLAYQVHDLQYEIDNRDCQWAQKVQNLLYHQRLFKIWTNRHK
jgi:hypothetical protein